MNTAVQQAITTRITQVDAEIQQATEILTSYVSSMNETKAQVDTWTHKLHVLGLEREELTAALPEEEQPADPEPTEDEEPEA